MKTTEKYLLYALILAVVALYIMHFTGSSETQVEPASDTLQTSVAGHKQGRIYYVNTDSVWANYKFVQDVNDDLIAKKQSYEGQLQRKLGGFEKDVMEFRQNGATMSQMEAQIKQNDLMKREQELTQLKENLEMKFITEEQEWNAKLRENIVNHIDSLTADKNYDYILGYSITSNIILANDSLELTREVLDGLNAEYLKTKDQE